MKIQRSGSHHLLQWSSIQHIIGFVEHPQTNDQTEVKVILNELYKCLRVNKGIWMKLLEVLWAYWSTPKSATQETPYNLTYGMNAMILVEVNADFNRRRNNIKNKYYKKNHIYLHQKFVCNEQNP